MKRGRSGFAWACVLALIVSSDRGEETLLNKLLNEMDGLRDDADILFLDEMLFAGGSLNVKLPGGVGPGESSPNA